MFAYAAHRRYVHTGRDDRDRGTGLPTVTRAEDDRPEAESSHGENDRLTSPSMRAISDKKTGSEVRARAQVSC